VRPFLKSLLILLALLRPVLGGKVVEPQQNFLGILLDDSRSMQIADGEGEDRRAVVRRLFGADGDLTPALAERFTLRWFRFASSASRIEGPEALTFDGTRTDLAEALGQARTELAGVPLDTSKGQDVLAVLLEKGGDMNYTIRAAILEQKAQQKAQSRRRARALLEKGGDVNYTIREAVLQKAQSRRRVRVRQG